MDKEQLIAISICTRASRLKLVRSAIHDAAEYVGLDKESADAVVLAVNEACMNIMQHGYDMQPDGSIEITVFKQADALVFQLRDYATPVDATKIHPRDLKEIRPGGLGINMIDSLMDEYGYLEPPVDGGNLFQMTKYLRHEENGGKR